MSEIDPTPLDDTPPPDPAVVAAADPNPVPDPPQDAEAIADAAEANALELPSGERLAEVGAIIALRRELKAQKGKAAEADTLRAELDTVRQQAAQMQPMAEAFQALQHAQAQAPPAPPAAPVVDTAGLEDLARNLDFYAPDGTLDLARATKFQAIIDRTAEAKAQQQVAPLVQQTARDKAAANIQKALRTVHPVNGDAIDPQILTARFAQIAAQPGGVDMLADEQAVKELWLNSYGLYSLRPRAAAAPVAPVAPLVNDRSGGNTVIGTAPTLSAGEKRAAKEAGLTEAEYLKIASKMPW